MRVLPIAAAACGAIVALALPATVRAQDTPFQVFAEFASEGGPQDVREVRLFVDGRDVSGDARVQGLRVAYTPAGSLEPGEHEARVVVVDGLGRSHEQAWTFSVVDPAALLPQVVFDPLPQRIRSGAVVVSGSTEPGAEVELSLDDVVVERLVASSSGRFEAKLELQEGVHEILGVATRMPDGDAGPEAVRRIERLAVRASPPADDPAGEGAPRVRVTPRGLPGDAATRRGGGSVEWPDPKVPEEPSRVETRRTPPPAGRGIPERGGQPPIDDPAPPPQAEVVITKPDPGDTVRSGRVTVLGRAPAGWNVVVRVNGAPRGSDTANPAGHFTIPQVELDDGANELIAEATSPDGQASAESAPVAVTSGASALAAREGLSLTQPARTASVARAATTRVEGTAWDGAVIEVEVNGGLAATDFAGVGGRFALDVPLEDGVNHVIVEAIDLDSGRFDRSPLMTVTRRAPARRFDPEALRPIHRDTRGMRERASDPPRSLRP